MDNEQLTPTPTVVVVTGASAGIGRATAVELARHGHGVLVGYRSRPEEAAETVTQIEALGGTARALHLDVADSTSFAAVRDDVRAALADTWGTDRLEAIVNNAGFGGGRAFVEMTEEAFDAYYRVLFHGPYFLAQTLEPLLADGGAILSVASSSAHPGDTHPGYSAYAGMKGGLIVASRYLAAELADRGIRVNTVSPGPTRTRLGDDAFAKHPELIPPLAEKTALGRIGEPEDVARVLAFLVSRESGWITGQDIPVTGGYAL